MNKCEWKDGKFYQCVGFNPVVTTNGFSVECVSCGNIIESQGKHGLPDVGILIIYVQIPNI